VAAAAEADDARCRLLVTLEGEPSAALRTALTRLAAADRLGGLIAAPTDALRTFAAALPVALIAPVGGTGGDGAVIAAPARDAHGLDAETEDEGEVAAAIADRRRRDPELILLADVGTSRHAAMEAGEAGADAVLFTGASAAVRDCVAWWSELFVLPVGAPAVADEPAALVAAGADFLLVEATRLIAPATPVDLVLERLDAAEAAPTDRSAS
jgi:thiamine-phosphate pyrophosphorylase